MDVSFKERVRYQLFEFAKLYKEKFIDVEYFIYTSDFMYADYYNIRAYQNNFLHLTGVITSLAANDFFDKCIKNELQLDDFSIGDKNRKGTIRRKLSIFPNGMNLFSGNEEVRVKEKFVKNNVSCIFSSSDDYCTMGFVNMKNSKPKTLLEGNQIKNGKIIEVIAKKEKGVFSVIYNKTTLSHDEILFLFKQNV